MAHFGHGDGGEAAGVVQVDILFIFYWLVIGNAVSQFDKSIHEWDGSSWRTGPFIQGEAMRRAETVAGCTGCDG